MSLMYLRMLVRIIVKDDVRTISNNNGKQSIYWHDYSLH